MIVWVLIFFIIRIRMRLKGVSQKKNDEVNLSWLSDNDRFGYEGIKSEDRVLNPLLEKMIILKKLISTLLQNSFIKSLKQ